MAKTYTFDWEGVKCTLKRATIGDAIDRDIIVTKLERRPHSVSLANFLTQTVKVEGDFPVQLIGANSDLASLEDAYNKWKTVEEPFVVAWQNAQVMVALPEVNTEKKAIPSLILEPG